MYRSTAVRYWYSRRPAYWLLRYTNALPSQAYDPCCSRHRYSCCCTECCSESLGLCHRHRYGQYSLPRMSYGEALPPTVDSGALPSSKRYSYEPSHCVVHSFRYLRRGGVHSIGSCCCYANMFPPLCSLPPATLPNRRRRCLGLCPHRVLGQVLARVLALALGQELALGRGRGLELYHRHCHCHPQR